MFAKWFVLPLFLAVAVAIAGCSRSTDAPPPDDQPDEPPPINVPPEDLKNLVDGNNQFAIDLYKKLAETEKGNIVFSPYSISSALAMTYAGARGKTAEEMAKVLHFTLPPEKLHPAFGASHQQLASGKNQPFRMNIASSLWRQQGYPFRPEFLELNRAFHFGRCREVDFTGNPQAACDAINRWVDDNTQSKIKQLVGPTDVNSSTRLMLANAVYFKGEWSFPFDPKRTLATEFRTNANERTTVPMMKSNEGHFNYLWTEEGEWLELPYEGDRVSMIVYLPAESQTDELSTIAFAKLERTLPRLKRHTGYVSLPKFQFNSALSLTKLLQSMGMPAAFSSAADFSAADDMNSLRISYIAHQALLNVDEHGSEAAAATAVGMAVSSHPPFTFVADRPFFVVLRDAKTATNLFMGRVARPSGSK